MRRRRVLVLVVVAALLIPLFVAVVALLLRTPANPGSAAGHGAASGMTRTSPVGSQIGGASSSAQPSGLNHVWLIVLENHSYSQIIGSSQAPNLNRLADRYGVATDFHAVARPSQPNYLALVSGSTQGVTDDDAHNLSAPSLFDQLEAAGLAWQVNAENVPGECFTGESARGGPDGPGTYARKHEPAISFTTVSRDATRCSRIRNLSAFDPAAAAFTLVIPNLCHDTHDCSVAVADRWLGTFVARITDSAAFREGGLLLITFDESNGGDQTQHIPLIYAAPYVAAGSHATPRATHYSLLRTVEEAFGLPCLAHACEAQPMPELLP